MASGIYAIVNTSNGKRYIGSSANIEKRRRRHWKDLRAGRHHSKYLQRAWNKYGEANFVFQVVEYIQPEFLLDIEQRYLNKNENGYNVAKDAEAPGLGAVRSEDFRRKVSEGMKRARAAKRWGPSKEVIAKIVAARKGQKVASGWHHTEETKAKWSEKRRGRKLPPEQVEKMRKRLMGHVTSEETKAKISTSLMGHANFCSPDYVPADKSVRATTIPV